MMNEKLASLGTPESPIRVFTVCTGVGLVRRGIESQTFDMFKGLHGRKNLDIKLFKGQGDPDLDEYRLWNLPRTGKSAKVLGKLLRRSSYVVEQISSFLPFVQGIRKFKPHIIYYSEQSLGFQLYQWRNKIGVPYRLILNNGGPGIPPFRRTHFIHQCTPFWLEQSLRNGEPANRHILVPLGIDMPKNNQILNEEDKVKLRKHLNLPVDNTIILSVGYVSEKSHKRMDHIINEIAMLPQQRPHLVMLGHMDEDSAVIIDLAVSKLGSKGFTVRSVPYEETPKYYQCADIFALCSLQEGFGRVYLEALMYGLPTIAHDHPNMRYVLGEEGIFVDMSKSGRLAELFTDLLQIPKDLTAMQRRQKYIRNRYSWDFLYTQYLDMFQYALQEPLPPFEW